MCFSNNNQAGVSALYAFSYLASHKPLLQPTLRLPYLSLSFRSSDALQCFKKITANTMRQILFEVQISDGFYRRGEEKLEI